MRTSKNSSKAGAKALCMAAFLAFAFQASAQMIDFTRLAREQAAAVVITGSLSTAGLQPPKAFDGDLTSNGRWIGSQPFPPAHIDYHMPADWEAGKGALVTSYVVVRLPS